MDPKDIKILPEFRDLIPPLSPDELDRLHTSLTCHGCRDALLVWKGHGILLDGHNRYAYCVEHDIPFRVEEIRCSTHESARNFIIVNQLARRNLPPDVASMFRGMIYNNRKKDHGGDRRSESEQSSRNSCALKKTAVEIATQSGVSPRTVENDAAFARAAESLGVTSDIIAGRETRSRREIVAEAKKLDPKPAKERKPSKRANLKPLRDRLLTDLRRLLDKYKSEDQAEVRNIIKQEIS